MSTKPDDDNYQYFPRHFKDSENEIDFRLGQWGNEIYEVEGLKIH